MITMHCGFLVRMTFRKMTVVSQVSGKIVARKLAAVVTDFKLLQWLSQIFKSGGKRIIKSEKKEWQILVSISSFGEKEKKPEVEQGDKLCRVIGYLWPQFLIWDRLGRVDKGKAVVLQNRASGERSEALEHLVSPSTTVLAPVNKIPLWGGRGGGLL